ncbi:hypothetical protein JTB14_009317 [Gonioctena quinquepunctata]|nr:hypothetical protein JTB14_009317 [Gonioctena quinquepunctata]
MEKDVDTKLLVAKANRVASIPRLAMTERCFFKQASKIMGDNKEIDHLKMVSPSHSFLNYAKKIEFKCGLDTTSNTEGINMDGGGVELMFKPALLLTKIWFHRRIPNI